MTVQRVAGHVFISYVREESDQVDKLRPVPSFDLAANGGVPGYRKGTGTGTGPRAPAYRSWLCMIVMERMLQNDFLERPAVNGGCIHPPPTPAGDGRIELTRAGRPVPLPTLRNGRLCAARSGS